MTKKTIDNTEEMVYSSVAVKTKVKCEELQEKVYEVVYDLIFFLKQTILHYIVLRVHKST